MLTRRAGREAVRSVVLTIRSLYDRQQHKFAGPYSTTASSRITSPRSTARRYRLCRPGHL